MTCWESFEAVPGVLVDQSCEAESIATGSEGAPTHCFSESSGEIGRK